MYFSDKITLRSVTTTNDADGYPVETFTDTEVFADAKSVTRAEFYAANQSGINATIAFDINAEDWNNQTRVVYGGTVYYIIRAYQKGLGKVELNCSDKE